MENSSVDPELEKIRQKRIQRLIKEKEREAIPVSDTPVHLTTSTFDDFISNRPVVFVDFWADWCGPCKRVEPILDELAKHFAGKVWVGKVNVDQHRELAMRYGANSIPTFWAYINGEPVQRYVGLKPKQAFARIFRELVKKEKERESS